MGSIQSDTGSVFCHISAIPTGTATSAAACWSRSAREGGYTTRGRDLGRRANVSPSRHGRLRAALEGKGGVNEH